MTLRLTDIDRWNPQAVREVADAAADYAASAATAARGVAGLAEADWDGVAARQARDLFGRTRDELEAQAETTLAAARAIGRGAERIAAIQARLRTLDAEARAARLDIDRATGVVGPGRSEAALALQVRLDELIADAEDLDDQLVRAMSGSTGLAPVPLSPTGPAVPGAGSAPEDVRRWWESLSPGQREELLTTRPAELGNLGGIPVADRDRANRAVLGNDTGAGADQVRDALELNSLRTGAEVLLLLYQPRSFGGQGRAAIAIGNPDTAAHTAVLVPGTANSVTSGWLGEMSVSNLFNEMTGATEPSESTAVVAWMGYDAPDSLIDPRVALPGLARQGGALLAGDLRALSVTAQRDSHTTVVGHSYGSTTVANAAAGFQMPADDVVLLGSPGTDLAGTAADFGLPDGGRVYVGSASADPVTYLAGVRGSSATDLLAGTAGMAGMAGMVGMVGLGADPAVDGFGSTRIKAETPGVSWQFWADHTGYFDPGSESLYSIVGIAAGDGALLAEQGMTAPHRSSLGGRLASTLGLPNWANPMTDPELLRPTTTGHSHDRGLR